MKTVLTLTLLSLLLSQTPAHPQNQSGLEMLALNVKAQVLTSEIDPLANEPPDSVTHPNPNQGRPTNRTETETERIERQTNLRIQNMHALENAKREPAQRPSIIKVYESESDMRNSSAKTIVGFAWAYQASPALQYSEDQEFVCAVRLSAGEKKRIKVISFYPNQKIVKVDGSGPAPEPVKPSLKDVVINQVQFSDGTTWTRPNWNPIILLRVGAASLGKGKCIQF